MPAFPAFQQRTGNVKKLTRLRVQIKRGPKLYPKSYHQQEMLLNHWRKMVMEQAR